jgi:hypothetical protein
VRPADLTFVKERLTSQMAYLRHRPRPASILKGVISRNIDKQ